MKTDEEKLAALSQKKDGTAPVTLPLDLLLSLLIPNRWRDRTFPYGVAYQSIHPYAHNTDPRPVIIPRALGEIIAKNAHPSVKLFLTSTHAELWDAVDWEISASRKLIRHLKSARASAIYSARKIIPSWLRQHFAPLLWHDQITDVLTFGILTGEEKILTELDARPIHIWFKAHEQNDPFPDDALIAFLSTHKPVPPNVTPQ